MSKKEVLWEDGWKSMEKAIAKLKNILEKVDVEQRFTSDEYMVLCTTIYNMCTQKPPHDYSQQLYENYQLAFEDYITSTVLPSLREKHDEFLLRAFLQRWVDHKLMVKWLSKFFHYLDRYFIPRKNLSRLDEAGVDCFREFAYREMSEKVRDAVIGFIHQEREGGLIDRALLKNVVGVFVEIEPPVQNGNSRKSGDQTYYDKDFESAVLENISAYYAGKASDWIVKDSCPEYMIKAEECLSQEKDRVAHYLQSSSESKLLERAESKLLSSFAKELIENPESGCLALLQDGRVADLSRMFRLFGRIPQGLEPVSDIFRSYVTGRGMALVTQAEEAAQAARSNKRPDQRKEAASQEHDFVRNVIKLHDEYLKYVEDCFQGHTLFHKALKEAFDVFCNKDIAGSSSPELFANFCDNVLKKDGDQAASEGTLESVVKLLSYVNDKDMFAEFCRKRLARRLLFDKSTNDDTERSFLSMLKQHCGGQFTSKMEGMTNDIRRARELQSDFSNHLEQSGSDQGTMIDLSTTVLTTGFWPSYKSHDLNLPSEMRKSLERFTEFYGTKTKHRRLTWIFSMGSCNVYAKYGQKTTELILSPYQACALLLFNSADRLTFSEITEQLNLEEHDVTRILYSLSCGKYKILNRDASSKTTISATDIFEYNPKFISASRRIRIPLAPVDEKKKIMEEVGKDRRHAIEASLVRVMKSRKVLNHQNLISECVEQLAKTFKPDIKMIKQRIEDLIVREYIERDAENPNTYKYLA